MSDPVQQSSSSEQTLTRRAFVVLGMHRSGTSAMTRALSLLGAGMPEHLLAANESNPTGHWEPQSIVVLNDEILEGLDSNWDDVFSFRPKRYLSNFDRAYLGRAVELLTQEFNGSDPIVLKDPRISILTTLWERALREAGYATHYVIMVRNPLEVADSLRIRNGFPREKSFLLWSSYMIAIDRDTRGCTRTFVSYDQLISDWRTVRSRIEEDAGVPFPRDTAAAAIEIDRFLNREMRHHAASSEDLLSNPHVAEQLKTLYRIFSEACRGGSIDVAALEQLQGKMEELDQLVGPLIADLRGSERTLTEKIAELTEAHASANERVRSAEQDLVSERSLRESEADTAARMIEEHRRELTDIAERITAAEAERDQLQLQVGQLSELLANVEAEAEKRIELETTRNRALEEILSSERAASQGRALKLKQKAEKAHAAQIAAEAQLEKRFGELAALTCELRSKEADLDAALDSRSNAAAVARAREGKLTQRHQEIATLTNLLRRQEEHSDQADDHVRWLQSLTLYLGSRPRWWDLMPKPWGRQRALKRLELAGLFDGDAYLRRYPDVATAGMDPLDHYLKHGLSEGRSREA